MRSSYPLRFAQRNVRLNVGDVVVLASPPRDPIRSSTTSGGASVICTRAAPRRLLLPRSSKYGGETDWIYNTTARCIWGRISAAGLRLQTVGRERGRSAGRLGLEGKVWGVGRPQPSLYRGGGAALAPPPSPNRRPQRIRSGGKETPLSKRSISSLNLSRPAGPYGALCPWPNAARALPHRPMPPPGRWSHVGPLLEGSRSFRYNTD